MRSRSRSPRSPIEINRKAFGSRPGYDENNKPIDMSNQQVEYLYNQSQLNVVVSAGNNENTKLDNHANSDHESDDYEDQFSDGAGSELIDEVDEGDEANEDDDLRRSTLSAFLTPSIGLVY